LDKFVLNRLEDAGLLPSPVADKRTLIRRVTFGLTGLPPTPEEVQAFETDASADAFAKVVDRLLASPHYGERWARHWLDVARYADTKGYVFQEDREYGFAYTFRDYVINAFNSDLPYDQFLKHQIAADLMDLGDDKKPLAAMGYLTLGRRFISNIHDITDDRIDVVTRGMLGLTVSCARCHDHKYDPISADDYYALYGVFRSSHEPDEPPLIEEPEPDDSAYQEFSTAVAQKQQAIDDELFSIQVELLSHTRDHAGDYLLAAHDSRDLTEAEPFRTLARDRELNFQVLDRWRDYLGKARDHAQKQPVYGPWFAFAAKPEAEFAAKAPELSQSIAENKWGGGPVNAVLAKQFEGFTPTNLADVSTRYAQAFKAADKAWTDLLAAHTQVAGVKDSRPLPMKLENADLEALRQELYGSDVPTNVPVNLVEDFSDVPTRNRLRNRRNELANFKATHPGRPDRAMVMYDNDKPFEPRVFLRGDPARKGGDVERRFVSVLSDVAPAPFTNGSGRLELAEAIANKANPLTARVFVNRVWMYHFGQPLVDTTSDFGLRSEPPTHPELLDHLAAEFMEQGWSVKALHRMILLSSTYQQSSENNAAGLAADPANRLLWRQNRQRLDFEAMRDAMLAASGRLDAAEVGGKSVNIVDAPDAVRRSVYAYVDRQNLPGLFRTFDFAGPDTHSPRRFSTTVPQQALYMMNDPFVVRQAQSLAQRVDAGEVENDRIERLYDYCLQRAPTDEERQLGLVFLNKTAVVEPAPVHPTQTWQYGYGTVDGGTGQVLAFTALPHFTGSAYQGDGSLPSANTGWATLNATGGHPGGDAEHAAVRRWTAPVTGTIAVYGELRHASEHGDGVFGSITLNGETVAWRGSVHNATIQAAVNSISVQQGDIVDFVVFCVNNESFDSFGWSPRIALVESANEEAAVSEWSASTHFTGPQPAPPASFMMRAEPLIA
ncbi:MAG: DUF1553 domain-containing protein, partial [Candidatus Hydrogenedentes bacterium]|nr:DUF1553 domain-containing protein [Candidatus Hydrogenedentota bacterium]